MNRGRSGLLRRERGDVVNLVWFILIGALAGFLAGKIMTGTGFGFLRNLIVGIIGGLLGGWLFELVELRSVGLIGSLITATVGSVVLLVLLNWLTRKKK